MRGFDSNIHWIMFRDRLELWRLGKTSVSSAGIGAVLPLDSEPVKVVEVGVMAVVLGGVGCALSFRCS